MNGQDFISILNNIINPFFNEWGFVTETPLISGRFYRASYSNHLVKVLITFEPGDNDWFVFIHSIENGKCSKVDDRCKTPRLSDLNSKYISKISSEEKEENDLFFSDKKLYTNVKGGGLIFKIAQELRLVIPKYLEDIQHKTNITKLI